MKRLTFFSALVVAAVGFTLPYVNSRQGFDGALITSFLMTVCWGVLVIVSIVQNKVKGLWLLLTAPFALYWPFSMVLLVLHGGPT
jgi:hypothetical protein